MKNYQAKPYSLSDFDFELPKHLIAQTPAPARRDSRLLEVFADGQLRDGQFPDLAKRLQAGDVLVMNNTAVIPARLSASKQSGGKLEVFIERIESAQIAICLIRANRAPKVNDVILIAGQAGKICERTGMFYRIELLASDWFSLSEQQGDIPLPPYIQRKAQASDKARYQTVYAKEKGAVAAPTAGLHFDEAFLASLQQAGIIFAPVTLHVGAGTFMPVKTENLDAHQMHFERFFIPQSSAEAINAAKQSGRRVVAIGTTSVRTLESAAKNGRISELTGDTNLFIRPGYSFEIVDLLLTNFHLPKSSLMMLVSAFAGYELIFKAYQHAIAKQYRFFSYGDAMLLERATCL